MVDYSLALLVIEKPKLKIQTNSNAYYRNLLPITQMTKDFSPLKLDLQTEMTVNASDFDKFGGALDSLSAYYEMEGEYKGKPAIFRFNIDGLRNNYTLVDLISYCNKYYDDNEPWVLFKKSPDDFDAFTFNCVFLMINVANLIKPFLPQAFKKISDIMGVELSNNWDVVKINKNITIERAHCYLKLFKLSFKDLNNER